MKVYLVGGAVRDSLLGIEPQDQDYVVVGSSPEEMLSLGFKKVGNDFPVFLHPDTGEEYALARTERKTSPGHTGFTCEWEGVTLEEDLKRRDFTINAMARDMEDWSLVDPLNGKQDLEDGILRRCTNAFKEDPVRILRAFRFAAKYGFSIEKFTWKDIIQAKKLDSLAEVTPERVWMEMEKALKTERPEVFFEYLGLYTNIFPEWENLAYTPQREDHHPEIWVDTHTKLTMRQAVKLGSPRVVFAALCHDFGKPLCYRKYGNAHGHDKEGVAVVEAFCDKWKVPNKYRELAILACRHHIQIHKVIGRDGNAWSRPKTIMKLFEQTGAEKDMLRFIDLLKVSIADTQGRGAGARERAEFAGKEYPQAEYLTECLWAVKSLDTKAISKQMLAEGTPGKQIGEAIRVAKINEIRKVQKRWKNEMSNL